MYFHLWQVLIDSIANKNKDPDMSCFNNSNSDSPLSSPSRRPTNQNTEPMSRTLSLTERGRPTEKRSATLGTKRLGKVKIDFRLRKIVIRIGRE